MVTLPVYKMNIGMYYYIANKNLAVVAKNILLIAPNFSRSESCSIEVLFCFKVKILKMFSLSFELLGKAERASKKEGK